MVARSAQGKSCRDESASLHDLLHAALDAGISHIDAAEMYDTEKFTGPAFQEYLAMRSRKREEFFITGKLWSSIPDVQGAMDKTLRYFQTEYLDLYLLHAPFLKERGIGSDVATVWRQLEE